MLLIDTEKVTKEAIVTLEASGSTCTEEKAQQIYDTYTDEKLDEELVGYELHIEYHIKIGVIKDTPESIKQYKARALCDIQENNKLVQYYKRYSFLPVVETDSKDPNFVPMQTTIKDIISYCNHSGKRKRTSKKRTSKKRTSKK